MSEDRDPMGWVAECRKRGCGTRNPDPAPPARALDWQMDHARQAHGDPRIGARYSLVREPRLGREQGRGSR